MIDDNSYYMEHLKEQIGFLVDHCSKYDNGNPRYAKLISGIIRTLIKDNPKNKQTISLFTSLGLKSSMKFYNTGYLATNPLLYVGLVGIVSVPARQQKIEEIDYLYLPVFENSILIDVQWITFDDWWESPILVKKSFDSSISLTRRDLVLAMAEQDGGVHIDKYKSLLPDYFNVTRGNNHIFKAENKEGEAFSIKNIQYAFVRQIAHELLISINNKLNIITNYSWSNSYYLNGVSESKIYQSALLASSNGAMSMRTQNPYKTGDFERIVFKLTPKT